MRLLVLAAVVLSTGPASAGTYIGLGVGTSANLSDSVNTSYRADGRSARGVLGYRIGAVSLEGMYSGFGYVTANTVGTGQVDSRSLQIAGKYSYALGDNFEVFGRLGLLRTDLTARDTETTTTGTGYTFSVGVEYRVDLLLTGFGLYVDYTRNQASFDTADGAQVDQSAAMWTAGVNLAL
ncbi:hypothetical protein BH11MYX1_BH11MYX1_23330 [soil metagenome]